MNSPFFSMDHCNRILRLDCVFLEFSEMPVRCVIIASRMTWRDSKGRLRSPRLKLSVIRVGRQQMKSQRVTILKVIYRMLCSERQFFSAAFIKLITVASCINAKLNDTVFRKVIKKCKLKCHLLSVNFNFEINYIFLVRFILPWIVFNNFFIVIIYSLT